jgi:cyclopropane-fatty-acyl-phospholipid synthase
MALRKAFGWERWWLTRLWEGCGQPPIQMELWDGTEIGAEPSQSVGRLIFRDPGVIAGLVWDPSLALGDRYSEGRIEIEGDLPDVLTAIFSAMPHSRSRSWRDWFVGQRGHSFGESRESVYHHYDLGNEFYRHWLDEQMAYTCAYYTQPDMTLEQAQIAKFDHVCRKLRLQPGEVVAEAGCGWGGLALHMAYNLSKEQLAYARHRARQEGLSDRVEFVEDDYRNISGKFEAFVSVGMLEHVGVDQFVTLGKTIDRVLTPNGRGLIHTIGRNAARRLDSWTEQRIFPGAEPPSLRQMMDIFEPCAFSVLDVENIRLHYAQTLRHWLDRYEAAVPTIAAMFDEKFVRMWRFYLACSIAAFVSGHLQLFQVVFSRARNNALPWTRADIYSQGSMDRFETSPFDTQTESFAGAP